MILEIAILNVIARRELEFEASFRQASGIIASINGYISHQLQSCNRPTDMYCWSIGIRWRIIPKAFAAPSNTMNGVPWNVVIHGWRWMERVFNVF